MDHPARLRTIPRRARLIGAVAAMHLLGAGVAAHAEEAARTASPSAAPPTVASDAVAHLPAADEKPQPAEQSTQVSGEKSGYLFDLSNLGAGFSDRLASHGFYLHGFYQQADVSVVGGGHERSSNYLGLGYWGADLDTEKAFGLKGGFFDFTISTQLGETAGAGNTTGSQSLVPWGFGDEVRLVDFYYDQSLFNGALHVTVGRMNQLTGTPFLSPGFHVTPWLCTFWSNSCGTPHAYNFNASHPGYQVGTWGGTITVHPARNWYIKTGVIENAPPENASRSHDGWPGRDWSTSESNGAFIPFQIGYITTPATSLYPTNFHVGGWFDTAKNNDKYYNSLGEAIARFHGAPLVHNNAAGMYAAIQQTVWRFSKNPKSVRGLAVFASGDWDITGWGDDQQQYEAGLIVTGPFASRAADSLNILVDYQVFDPREKAARDTVAALHNLPYTMQNQSGYEVNYGFAAAPGLVISPYLQYVNHPDQLTLAVPDPRDDHATVVGVRMVTNFNALFGLKQPGG